MARLYFLIIFILTIFVCLLAPQSYDYGYSVFCAVLYWLHYFTYLIIKKKENYFDFDNLFFIAFFFVALYYASIMYESDPYRYIFYQLYFNKDKIPLGSGIALLAANGYLFGAVLTNERSSKFSVKNSKKIKTTWMFMTALLLVVLYILSGGYANLINEYIGGVENVDSSAASTYFFVFFPAFLLAGIIAEFYNLKIEKPDKISLRSINKLGIIVTVTIFLMFFLVGSRTIPLQIILVCIGLYTLLFKSVGFSRFLLFVFVGFIGLASVGFLRTLVGRGTTETFHVEDSAMDLIVNNRNTYVLLDHVDKYGYSHGISMLSPLLAPLPFAQSIVINLTGINEDEMRSALITTKDTFGEVGNWGLGTNIVGDVYLAFGIFGIIIMFPIIGYYVNKLRINSNNSALTLCLYAILLSYAVYLPRAEFFYFLRYFVWCSIIFFIGIRVSKIKAL